MSFENETNTDQLAKVISSICTIMLEQEVNADDILNIRNSIDPNMDFISLIPKPNKNYEFLTCNLDKDK